MNIPGVINYELNYLKLNHCETVWAFENVRLNIIKVNVLLLIRAFESDVWEILHKIALAYLITTCLFCRSVVGMATRERWW